MLQKLRLKFFALAIGLLFLVLAVIIGGANFLNYRNTLASSDYTLKILLANDGKFPAYPNENGKPPDWEMSPERPFETRYFTVQLDQNENITAINVEKIAAVSKDIASDYIQEVLHAGKDKGFVENYRYIIQTDESGGMVIFLDCGRQLDAVKSFLKTSVAISAAGLLLVSLLLYVFSARVVKPIADSYEKQKQFITNASHDLKTPITIINADVDVLEMDHGENEWLQDIQNQTKRLTELIEELLFLSRMEEKNQSFPMIDFPLSDVVKETAQSFEALAAAGEKSLVIDVQPMLSYTGNEKAIRRLVTVLLDNAVKYGNEKEPVTISLQKTEKAMKLKVHNSCPSMTSEEIHHLFDRFYRGDQSRNSQRGGYGIGLSMAKAIVQAHGGVIHAESPDRRSLTITASLPLK